MQVMTSLGLGRLPEILSVETYLKLASQIASQKIFFQRGDQHIYVDDRKNRSSEIIFPKTRNGFKTPLYL